MKKAPETGASEWNLFDALLQGEPGYFFFFGAAFFLAFFAALFID
jgi:hypothetical protein